MAINLVTYVEDVSAEDFTVENVPAKPQLLNIPEVEGRVICFYGFKPIIDSMKTIRRNAIKNGTRITRVQVKAKNSSDARGSLEGMSTEEAISIWRADVGIRNKMAGIIKDEVGSKYKGIFVAGKQLDDLFEVDPSLFNILWSHPDFAHINVFLWRGKYSCASQLGMIRDRSLIEAVDATS